MKYKLPDSTFITLPDQVGSMINEIFKPIGTKRFPTIGEMVNSAISVCEDLKCDSGLFNGFIMTGGNSNMNGFEDQVKVVLQEVNSQYNLSAKIFTFPNEKLRSNNCWIGGSILGSIDNFHQLFITKAEYEEHGVSIFDRKLP